MDLYAQLRTLDANIQRGNLSLRDVLDEYRRITRGHVLSDAQLSTALAPPEPIPRIVKRR